MSKMIELHGKYGAGKFAIVDDEDYELVSQHRWLVDVRGYVNFNVLHKRVYLHRFILKLKEFDGTMVDHKKGNKLDNRKSQLRKCTNSQNQANTKSWGGKEQKGIYLFKNRWVARIMVNGVRKFLGRFKNKEEALIVYKLESKKQFGEFSYDK